MMKNNKLFKKTLYLEIDIVFLACDE